mmetsp:Transcript_30432/g.94237  ORF Transcript_30432/g.94237 Transcript_30432/m.94237 type:complete len:397 (-) Transcript_30432:443-1633(-)
MGHGHLHLRRVRTRHLQSRGRRLLQTMPVGEAPRPVGQDVVRLVRERQELEQTAHAVRQRHRRLGRAFAHRVGRVDRRRGARVPLPAPESGRESAEAARGGAGGRRPGAMHGGARARRRVPGALRDAAGRQVPSTRTIEAPRGIARRSGHLRRNGRRRRRPDARRSVRLPLAPVVGIWLSRPQWCACRGDEAGGPRGRGRRRVRAGAAARLARCDFDPSKESERAEGGHHIAPDLRVVHGLLHRRRAGRDARGHGRRMQFEDLPVSRVVSGRDQVLLGARRHAQHVLQHQRGPQAARELRGGTFGSAGRHGRRIDLLPPRASRRRPVRPRGVDASDARPVRGHLQRPRRADRGRVRAPGADQGSPLPADVRVQASERRRRGGGPRAAVVRRPRGGD